MKRFFMLIFLPFATTTIKYAPTRTDTQKDYDGPSNFNHTYYPKLENFYVGGSVVYESSYPYIAKVVHSIKSDLPYLCTAACVEKRVFMTAARCLTGHALQYVRVIYKGKRLKVTAFVLPLKETKQQFDDIGFIVTNDELNDAEYDTVAITTRPKNNKDYAASVPVLNDVKVIGYARAKDSDSSEYNLIAIDAVVDIMDLRKIYSEVLSDYGVPLYNPAGCYYAEFKKNVPSCEIYLGAEGALVIEGDKAFGVATWGYVGKRTFPVGFALTSEHEFQLNYKCAKFLAENQALKSPRSYQEACDSLP